MFGARRAGVVVGAVVKAVAAAAVELAGPCDRGRGEGRQAGEGGRQGLGVRRLQAPLLAALQARDARGDRQPGEATAAWQRKCRAAFAHRGHAHRDRFQNYRARKNCT